jgi:hypothetical protein
VLLVVPAVSVSAVDSLVTVDVKGLSGVEKANVAAAVSMPLGIVHDKRVEERWLKRSLDWVPQLVSESYNAYGASLQIR